MEQEGGEKEINFCDQDRIFCISGVNSGGLVSFKWLFFCLIISAQYISAQLISAVNTDHWKPTPMY